MKIAFFEIEGWEKPFFEDSLKEHDLIFEEGHLTDTNIDQIKDVDVFSGMVWSVLDRKTLEQFKNLKLITTRSTGYDHIDLQYCKEKNISVCNVPEYGANTVAEHTFALILALSRKIIPSVERTRKGNFSLTNLRGFDLYGKTIGIIGVGHIGKAAIRIAKGLGMKVIAYSRNLHDDSARDMGFRFVDFDELISTSDIVSLHLPYNEKTHHLINKENIMKFKKGSMLINTSRGGIVETEAILNGLNSNILSAVGLDVLEEECVVKEERALLTDEFLKTCDIKTQLLNHVLLNKENVIITPHNAFNSEEALQRIVDVTIRNIRDFSYGSAKNTVI